MYTKTLQIGQKINCILYGGMDGYITDLIGIQLPETCKKIGGGIGCAGGNAQLQIAFEDHFSLIPESLARTSVQWHIYETVINSEELEAFKAKTQANLDAKAQAAAKKAKEKSDEEARQRTAPEFSHLKPVTQDKDETTETAKNIRAQLKKEFPGVKFSVKKEHYGCINVRWEDGPATKDVDEALENFRSSAGIDVDDSEIMKRHAWIFGTVRYLFTNHDYSDAAINSAIEKINAKYNNTATIDQYKNGNLPPLCSGADWNSYNVEIRKVLNNEVDYELQAQHYARKDSVTKILNAEYGFIEGHKKPDNDVIQVWFHDGAWSVGPNWNATRYPDDLTSNTAEQMAALLSMAYKDELKKYSAEKAAQEAEAAINNQQITPLSEEKTSRMLVVKFPACNKNHGIAENDEEIQRKSSTENCRIVKTITLSNAQFEVVAGSLLNDRPDLWEKIGGREIDDKYLDGLQEGTPNYYEAWRVHGITQVVEVFNETKTDVFYVNPEGFNYARYVGRTAQKIFNGRLRNSLTK